MTHETRDERPHTEPVVLDIGGDFGALVIYTDGSQSGREIELSPVGESSARFHNQVHERCFGDRVVYAAVYPGIRQGTYDVWRSTTAVAGTVLITGGRVAYVDWRSPDRP